MELKPKKYQKYEKIELVNLLKCKRERQRQHILDKLNKHRDNIEKPYKEKIEEITKNMNNAVEIAGLKTINVRSCMDSHPELDKFDSETNKLLTDIWNM